MAPKKIAVKFELTLCKTASDTLYLSVTHPQEGMDDVTFFLKIELPPCMTEAEFVNNLEQINARLRETR